MQLETVVFSSPREQCSVSLSGKVTVEDTNLFILHIQAILMWNICQCWSLQGEVERMGSGEAGKREKRGERRRERIFTGPGP